MSHSIFTIVAEIRPDRLDSLRATLAEVGADPAGNAVLPLGGFDGLHFACAVIAEEPGLPPTLILENNVDGPVDQWLPVLVGGGRGGMDALFGACKDYPAEASDETIVGWLADHVVRPGAWHVGAIGRSLPRIRQEAGLHDAIEAFLDAEQAAGRMAAGTDPAAVRAAVQRFVDSEPRFAWARSNPPTETKRETFVHRARLAAWALLLLVTSPVVIPALLVWLGILRVKELRDPVQTWPPDPDEVRAELETEDVIAQNHLASAIPVKPGFVRVNTLKLVLFILNVLARVIYAKGELGGIPSIHFAHWSLINNDRHLVFVSNFDGSWESYLGDFIDKAAIGLTGVWSNTVYFPRTKLVVLDGATDGPRFRQWARASQCVTNAWYSAYPELTMAIIQNNTAIRQGLYDPLAPKEVVAWVRRL